jgi:hypothetical protein
MNMDFREFDMTALTSTDRPSARIGGVLPIT